MPSSGSKGTGVCDESLGPFRCDNCQKWQDGVCYDAEVAQDKTIKGYKEKLLANGYIMMLPGQCSNEFLSLKDKQKWDGKLPKPRKEANDGIGHMILMGKRPPAK